MSSIRSASKMKCRRRSLRWLVLSFWVRNRNAGKLSRLGSCFMMRCNRMGNPTRAAPTRRIGCMRVLYRDRSGSFEIPLLAVSRSAVGGERGGLNWDHLAPELPAVEDTEVKPEDERVRESARRIE